jgi:hypothetical protein
MRGAILPLPRTCLLAWCLVTHHKKLRPVPSQKQMYKCNDVKGTVNASGVLVNKPLIANYQSIY